MAGLPPDLAATFACLKAVLQPLPASLQLTRDSTLEWIVHTTQPSPYKQHKGQPMYFASVRRGKNYVSLHVFALYTHPELLGDLSPAMLKRMQGKSCFNFKTEPEPAMCEEIQALMKRALKIYKEAGLA